MLWPVFPPNGIIFDKPDMLTELKALGWDNMLSLGKYIVFEPGCSDTSLISSRLISSHDEEVSQPGLRGHTGCS